MTELHACRQTLLRYKTMATDKKKSTRKSRKKTAPKRVDSMPTQSSRREKFKSLAKGLSARRKSYLSRRPHRSFKLTRRRDYKRSLKLPGYISMTKQVFGILLWNKRIFIGLAITYAVLTLLLSSIMSEDTYQELKNFVDQAGSEEGMNGFVSLMSIFWGVFTGQVLGASIGSVGSASQAPAILFGVFSWLASIMLLRAILAGKKPKMRDGLYSSGGPVLALIVLVGVIVIQSIPGALAFIAYTAAESTGMFSQTATLMLFGGAAILLSVLSLYWITGTLIAMVIATLPGMYPMHAIKLAGDIVVGRRMRVLLRLLWMVILLLLIWVIVLIPVILIDGALKSAMPSLTWLPIVPVVALFLMSFSIVFAAAYVYLFYRKVVQDDADPA